MEECLSSHNKDMDSMFYSNMNNIIEMAHDTSSDVRKEAIEILIRNADKCRYTNKILFMHAEREILASFMDVETEARCCAINGLTQISSSYALGVAIKALNDTSSDVRFIGLLKLRKYFRFSPKAIRALKSYRKQSDDPFDSVLDEFTKPKGIRKLLAYVPFI